MVVVGDAAAAAEDSDLEFWHADDCWYSVRAVFDGRELTVKYVGFLETTGERYCAGDLKSVDDIERFKRRFRPASRQLQDNECSEVRPGTFVCASHTFPNGDLRFHDAIVEEVKNQKHSFVNGEEECLCTFLIEWQHGPNKGNLAVSSISNICLISPTEQNNPMVASFLDLAVKSIPRSLQTLPTCDEGISSCWESMRQDMDVGGQDTSRQHLIIVENMEKGIASKAVVDFIKDKTSIRTQAFISPSLSSESYTRGIILVDCRENLEKLYKFVENPNHIIISTTGRPWVVTETGSGFLRTPLGNLKQDFQQNSTIKDLRSGKRLRVACFGTHEYRMAKQLRDLFKEFADHQLKLHNALALEERKIMQACHGA